MDPTRFDALARALAAPKTRRGLLGGIAALGAGLLGARAVEAQVTEAQCGNKTCKNNPGRCGDACVCCVYSNGNSRCRPPGMCAPGETACPPDRPVLDASGRCVASPGGCSGPGACEDGDPCTTNVCIRGECVTGFVGDGQQGGCDAGQVCCAGVCKQGTNGPCGANGDCCSGMCQGRTCVATVAGTCTSDIGVCGNEACTCLNVEGTLTCGSIRCGFVFGPEDCQANSSFFSSLFQCGDRPACVRPCDPDPECFTGETRIAMADGTSRPIELIAVGDHVLGQGGINRVEAVMRPRLGSKPLYALNDGPFFVTAEHPFLTDTGWKAIDPSATAAENPRLAVGRLAVGDRLLALAGVPVLAGGGNAMEAVVPELTPVAVELIRETRADPATPLYNLRLDGDHTYVANDVVVHNK